MKTKEIALSAMIMSVIGVFLLLDRITGSAMMFMVQFLLPLPFAYYTAQHGNRNGFFLLVATSLMSLIISTLIGTISIVFYGLMGWIYGYFVNRGANRLQLLTISFVVDLIIVIITVLVLGSMMGYGSLSEQLAYLEEMAHTIFSNFGVSTALVDRYLKPIFYLQTLFTAFLEAYLVHTLYLILTMRLKKPLPEPQKLSEVSWPKITGYLGLLGVVGTYYLPSLSLGYTIDEIAWFAALIGQWYLIFHGILFFYRIKGQPIFRKIGFYSIILVILFPNFLVLPMSLLGFLAVVSDLVERVSK